MAKTIRKKPPVPEYPKSAETFLPPILGAFGITIHENPSSFNGRVYVEKYRVTIEKVDEPIEAVQQRIQDLWDICDNWHQWEPLQSMAKKFNYTLQGEQGNKRPKK